jgi:D-tyrosyl-tRNA(Tyr) deacylase
MIAVVQRVKEAKVDIDGQNRSRIGLGALVLLGVEKGDTEADAEALARKLVELRMFPDPEGKMNLSVKDVGGEMLVVSQFTLAADCRKGRRPSFDNAAPPELAETLYNGFVARVQAQGIGTKTGEFAAVMEVGLVNDGPVTFILRCRDGKPSQMVDG